MSDVFASLRPPAVAGRFYQQDPSACAGEARYLCAEQPDVAGLPETLLGAVVPHAGWVCSGRIAAGALNVLRRGSAARTFFMTGSVHTVNLDGPALDTAEAWSTPLGPVPVDAELRAAIAELPGFTTLDAAHQAEHSLEVQLPLMQVIYEGAFRIVPCMIPPSPAAVDWGSSLGGLLADWPEPVGVIASTDLTHYGPNYRFAPRGVGEEGRRWAHEVNDRRILQLIEGMNAAAVVSEARTNRSACGGGAIAATMAAVTQMGATRGYLLEHSDSVSELARVGHRDPSNSVGYAGMVFG